MVFDVICQEDDYRRNKNTDLMLSFLAANQSMFLPPATKEI